MIDPKVEARIVPIREEYDRLQKILAEFDPTCNYLLCEPEPELTGDLSKRLNYLYWQICCAYEEFEPTE